MTNVEVSDFQCLQSADYTHRDVIKMLEKAK